jgi:hypothetical protein
VRSLALSVAAGKEAAKRGVKAFVELSTGMVYKPDSQPSKEGDKLKPWSKIAVFKLQAEEQLASIEGYVALAASYCRPMSRIDLRHWEWPQCLNLEHRDRHFREAKKTQANLSLGST